MELLAKRKDGSEFPVEVSLSGIRTKKGLLITSIIRDITERVQAEAEIRRSHQSQRFINTLLRIAIEDLPLKVQLERALNEIISIPWLPHMPKGGIFLTSDDADRLVLAAHTHFQAAQQRACASVPTGRCLCGQAMANRQSLFVDQIDECHAIQYEGMTSHGHYCVPILSGEKVLGVFVLYVEAGSQRDERIEELLLAIANTLAGMIERKRGEESLLKLSSAVEQSADGVIITDRESLIQYVQEKRRRPG